MTYTCVLHIVMLGRSRLGYEISEDLEVEESGQKAHSVPKIVFRKTVVMLPLMAPRWGYREGSSLTNWILVSGDLGFRSLSVRFSSEGRLACVESLGCRGLEPMTSCSAAGLEVCFFHRVHGSVEVGGTRRGWPLGRRVNPLQMHG